MTEPNERLIEFATGGICNAVADTQNAKIVCDCGGVPALIDCLSSPVRNTVKYAIAGFYYLWEIGGSEVKDRDGLVELINKYCEVDVFSHLATVLLDKILQTKI